MNQVFDISRINKVFESRVRLGIMSILAVNDDVDFNTFKTLLNLTDGNLSSHLSALETLQFIEVKKEFIGKKPKSTYRVTQTGREVFKEHLNELEKLLKYKS
jgi:DNA-binding HxlR family transcriptional regulator